MKRIALLLVMLMLPVTLQAQECGPDWGSGTGTAFAYWVAADDVQKSRHTNLATALSAMADSIRVRPEAEWRVRADFRGEWRGTCAESLDTIIQTDTVTGGGTDYTANEPGGYVSITDRGFDEFDEDGWDDNDGSSLYDVPETDANAPTSASGVARVTFPAAEWVGGSSPCNQCARRDISSTDDLYFAFTFRVSSNWHGHSSGVNKILWVRSSTIPASTAFGTFTAYGIDDGSLTFQYRLANTSSGSESSGRNLDANVGSASITRGQWYEIEVRVVMNTGDNFDGELHVWMDGTKTHEYTDVKHFGDDGTSHQIDQVYWGPVYGGTGDQPPSEQYQYIDNFYISVPSTVNGGSDQ